MTKASFPPVIDTATRVLILGSLPGERSLAAGRYYAHPQNQFWRLAGAVIDRDLAGMQYEARLATLLAAGIGLWDTVATATRKGSSDAALRDVSANDLPALVKTLPSLRVIAFNGAAAAKIGTTALRSLAVETITLPSSSPLYTVGISGKLSAWLTLREWLALSPRRSG